MTTRRAVSGYVTAAVLGLLMATSASARDAAFLDPGSGGGNNGTDVEDVRAEPKAEIDIGETTIHSAKRQTLFFANTSTMPVKVEKLTVNSDANVQADITNDDCSKQGTIAPQSKCSVEINITPTSSGAWSVEILLTHNGAGRIARARVAGKTSGGSGGDKKETGLDMLSKQPEPINFAEVEVGSKTAHSALMVNDSADPISIYSIDVIEADNGLKILEGGCEVDMQLKAGESCPVTLVWEPTKHGQVATDLIIRHSGRQGFVVIPVRGKTKGDEEDASKTANNAPSSTDIRKGKSKEIPPPPGADDLEKLAEGRIAPMMSGALDMPKHTIMVATLRLIGTVGNRAVLLLPDGTTKVANAGDDIPLGDQTAKVDVVSAKSVELTIDGKKKVLELGSSPELVAHATAVEESSKSDKNDKDKNDKKSGSDRSNTPTGHSTSASGIGAPQTPPPSSTSVLPASSATGTAVPRGLSQ